MQRQQHTACAADMQSCCVVMSCDRVTAGHGHRGDLAVLRRCAGPPRAGGDGRSAGAEQCARASDARGRRCSGGSGCQGPLLHGLLSCQPECSTWARQHVQPMRTVGDVHDRNAQRLVKPDIAMACGVDIGGYHICALWSLTAGQRHAVQRTLGRSQTENLLVCRWRL